MLKMAFLIKSCVVPKPRTEVLASKDTMPKSKLCLEACFEHDSKN